MREILDWERITNKITEQWIWEYFELDIDEDVSIDWIGSDVGGIFEFADMFISFQNILDCYKHKVSKEKFHEWYWWCLDNQSVNISLSKFILSAEEKDK